MFQQFLYLFLVSILINLTTSFDYCKLCSNHVACNNNGRFARSCQNPKSIKLSTKNIQTVLHAHNVARNKIAGGGEPRFSTASKMPVMHWDPELAFFAELNIRKCNFNHDGCIKSRQKNYIPGQNLYIYSERTSDINGILKNAVKSWYDEVNSVNPLTMSGGGHFTQVVRDHAKAIGCAVGQSDIGTLVTCNYSFGNVGGLGPVYVTGSTGSACKNGMDIFYRNLCRA